jgi:hypothetical protein
MKDVTMLSDWRTVQLFLDDDGVSEVEVDSLNPYQARCSCKQGAAKGKCAHLKHVRQIMDENKGHYTVHIPVEVDEDVAEEAMASAAAFREFIIKYGKVEVL